jgi:hypothetical protein
MATQLVTFSTKIDIPTNGKRSGQVVSDDFDGDGNKDLAVLNYGLNSGGYDIKSNISLLFGNGKGAFGQAITYEINNSSAYLFEKGDFNQDGKTDLVVASDNYTMSVLLNNSKGGFTNIVTSEVGNNRPVGSFTVGDFNNDGKNDLAITSEWDGGNAVLLGNGKGSFDRRIDYSFNGSSQVAVADFNGDGILDLASASAISSPTGYKSVPIMIGKGDGSFNSPVYVVDKMTFASISTGDINGDGKVDIIASTGGKYWDFSNSVALIGNGKGEFGKPLSLAKDGYFKVLDLNGDKITDLITVQGGLLIGNGDGNFSIANNVYDGWSLSVLNAPNALAVDDFNKDGKLDLAIPNFQLNSVAVLINTTGENYLPTGNVTISGNASQNQTLSASNTLVDVNGLGPVSYQWLKDGVAINAATQSTYMLTQADVGKKISVKASYTDALGTAESVISAETMGVTNVNDVPTGVVTITGIAAQNQVLMANNTLIDVDGLGTISYFWQRDGVDINAATQSTYMLTQADVGKKISVKASYTDLLGTVESVNGAETEGVTNVNDVPTGTVTITGTPTQNQVLTANNNLADADGLGVISYTWLRDGTAINTATQSTYALTQADVGKKISVKASYTDLLGMAESVSSTETTTVVNVNDAPTGNVTITGTPTQNQVLTASNNLADADGLDTISYTWLRDGAAINAATQPTYTLTQADVGKKLSVKASYTDLLGTAESVSSTATTSVANVNDTPTGTVTIAGTPTQNQILTASNNLADADGLSAISYTWLRDGTAINTATQSTYTLTQADVGKKLSVKASYTDLLGTVESVNGAETVGVTNVNDVPTGTVTITGMATQNQILTSSNNLADADGLGAISYTWLRDGTAINSATQSTYALTQADVGKKISVKASYTDALGTVENLSSLETTAIIDANDAPTGTVKITGTAIKGQILSATNNLADIDGLGAISYTWLNNGVAIPNATQSTYKLTQIDTGQYVSVKASYIDLQSTSESATSGTILVSANQAPTGTATIKGLSTWGTTLSITSTIKDADGIGKLSYTWQNDKTTLSTNATYTLADSDIGKQLWAIVSYTDKKGNLEEVKSNAINVIVSDKPSAVNDVITGTDVANKLNGLAGNDTLIGGLGKDSLTGGVGADVFKFNSVNDSSALPKQADIITDFKHAQGDKIDLSAIDANSVSPSDQAFTLITTATFSADATGQLRFDAKTSTLYGSTNADAVPEFAIVLSGVKTLVAEDFIL